MSLSFVLLAIAIVLPFVLFAMARSMASKQQKQQQMQKLLLRVGINKTMQKGVLHSDKPQQKSLWMLWWSSLFKKAGLQNRAQVVQFWAVQIVFIVITVSAFILKAHLLLEWQKVLLIFLPFIPAVWLMSKIHERQKQMKQQFPDMLDSVVRSLRSGYSIDGAIKVVAEDMQGPLAEELQLVNKQMTIGISMRDILREFQTRVDLPEARFFVITLIIQRETGGKLAAILEELSRLMRRRENFQAKLKTLTAESRFTAWFIGGLPIVYIAYKYFFDRPSMQFFLNDPTGLKLFIFALAMIAIGTLILRSMLKMRF